MTDILETPIGKMWLDDTGLLWHQVDALVVTPDEATKVREAVVRLTGGRSVPAIVDIRQVAYADPEARGLFAKSSDESLELATALIVDSTQSQSLGKIFLTITKPDRPVRMFTDPDDAADWAKTFLPETA